MYIVNNQITIRFNIAPTASPLLEADYDIRTVEGDLDTVYTEAATITYVPPTVALAGSIEYVFTPNVPGLWKVMLTCGTAAAYTVKAFKRFWVFCAPGDFTTPPSTDAFGVNPTAAASC